LLEHYPADPILTGLKDPFSKSDYEQFPLFLDKSTINKSITFSPKNGLVTARLGQVLNFDVTRYPLRKPNTTSWYSVVEFDADGNMVRDSAESYDQQMAKMQNCKSLPGGKLHFEYTVSSKNVKGLYLFDGKDYILAYRLKVEDD